MSLSRLAYERKGSGEPVVLIHGIGHRRQTWDPIFNRLAEKYDVIALDLAGFGESPAYPMSVKYNMDSAIENLTENFAEWGIERPHVVGNSLGGAISLELAARGHVASATALSPAGFFGFKGRLQALAVLLPIRFASLLPLFLLRWLLSSSFIRKEAARSLYAHPERATKEALYGDAKALHYSKAFERTAVNVPKYSFAGNPSVPVTVAWGDKDMILNPKQADEARKRLPNGRHVSLPQCGHVPMIDDPELIIRVIDQTIAETHAEPQSGAHLREIA
ncbi:MAG: alpha/beta hydrolase [Aeromicrobium sp.]